MDVAKVHQVGNALYKLVRDSFAGHPNVELRHRVDQLADDARYASDFHPYIEEKVAGLKALADVVYSQKKHARYSGPEAAKSRLSHYMHALAYWSPSEGSENYPSEETLKG